MMRLLIIAAVVFLLWRLLGPQLLPRANPTPRRREPGPRSPWEVLEVSPSASSEEIRAAYQAKVRQYHPDKVASMGPELQEVAERHTKEINAAYEAVRKR